MQPENASRLRRAVHRLARELNVSASTEGLSPSQASALGIIVARGPLGVSELAEIEGVNPTMVSRMVRILADAGLVTRGAVETDQRFASIEATKRGRALDKKLRAARDAIVTKCVAALDPAEIEAITSALPALENLVDELQANRSVTAL